MIKAIILYGIKSLTSLLYRNVLLFQSNAMKARDSALNDVEAFRAEVIHLSQQNDFTILHHKIDAFIASLARKSTRDHGFGNYNYHCLVLISSLITAKSLPLAQCAIYVLFAFETFSENLHAG